MRPLLTLITLAILVGVLPPEPFILSKIASYILGIGSGVVLTYFLLLVLVRDFERIK